MFCRHKNTFIDKKTACLLVAFFEKFPTFLGHRVEIDFDTPVALSLFWSQTTHGLNDRHKIEYVSNDENSLAAATLISH
jgi:hypothetical protein